MKIYTRTGDYGKTSTLTGEKVSKACSLIELQGTIDEVNSCTGYLRALVTKYQKDETQKKADDAKIMTGLELNLKDIQYALFCIGADITGGFKSSYIMPTHIKKLEDAIDRMTKDTGKLKSFIYLSGNETACYAHIVRSVTRRAERVFVVYLEELIQQNSNMEIPEDYKYINRLADFFFQTARYLNYFYSVKEEEMHL